MNELEGWLISKNIVSYSISLWGMVAPKKISTSGNTAIVLQDGENSWAGKVPISHSISYADTKQQYGMDRERTPEDLFYVTVYSKEGNKPSDKVIVYGRCPLVKDIEEQHFIYMNDSSDKHAIPEKTNNIYSIGN
jgi:hypothetical protein